MPVCIAGMHRSGTSMVTRLLNLAGVYLGSEGHLLPPGADNTKGYWEDTRFRDVNDQLLGLFGGGWDLPPDLPAGWERDRRLDEVRERASRLVNEFSGREPWGWKDPRNSLTLPFWRTLTPEISTVVCVRHPAEVADSLTKRASCSWAFGTNLWKTYNQAVMRHAGGGPVVFTHYDTYFDEPESELRRVLRFLGLPVHDSVIDEACSWIEREMRHNTEREERFLGDDMEPLYEELCRLAGRRAEAPVTGTLDSEELAAALATMRAQLHMSEDRADRLEQRVLQLQTEVDLLSGHNDELNEQLTDERARCSTMDAQLDEIANSRGWRALERVRSIRTLLGRTDRQSAL